MWKVVNPTCYKDFERVSKTHLTSNCHYVYRGTVNGTLLATILSPLIGIAGAYALLAYFPRKEQQEAERTHKGHEEAFVTREELDAAIEKVAKDLEWEWTEMYEKFENLHLRLAKRDARAKAKPDEQIEHIEQPVLDIRQYRRL